MANEFKVKNGLLVESGESQITGSLIAPNITGSLLGTSSWAGNSVTSSYALNAAAASSFPYTGSAIISGSLKVIGYVESIEWGFTGSLQGTSSWAEFSTTASYSFQANSSSYAATASSADSFLIRQDLTGSSATFTSMSVDNLTVLILVSSSTDFSSGSTIFGNSMTNTHQFTGSVFITGSLYATSSWAQTAVTVQDQNFAIVYAVAL